MPRRPTIGLLSTWPIYQGTTIDRHAHVLVQGIRAAAEDRACRLLIGGGVDAGGDRRRWRTAWPTPGEGTDFVPVGPWNTDGLIVVSDDLSDAQAAYLRDVQASRIPVVFTTPEGPGPRVVVDNRAGINAAFEHLLEHGHRSIAFVAGTEHRGGDSAERLRAFIDRTRAAGMAVDRRLIAYGGHRFDDGRAAMERILEAGMPFTGLIASNDLSCLGAIDALRRRGRRIPDDIAVIGFDDILDARSHSPPLTTVRHPTFALGYQSVVTLLDCLAGTDGAVSRRVVPVRLIRRRSCGCQGTDVPLPDLDVPPAEWSASLARHMAEAAFTEARHMMVDELEERCRRIVAALGASIERADERPMLDAVTAVLSETEALGEDAHVWQAAVSTLHVGSDVLVDGEPPVDGRWSMGLLDRARVEISEDVQRRTTHSLLQHMDMMSQLGMLTAQLNATREMAESSDLLARFLPRLGIGHFLVALFDSDEDDPVGTSRVVLAGGLPEAVAGMSFPSRRFPPNEAFESADPLQLVVLPLRVDEHTAGFVALPAAGLEPAAAIVANLAMAIRASRLYQEAVEGRVLAEEASRLKTRFLSMVSHELRTPVSVLVGLSDMVLRDVQRLDGASQDAVRDLQRLSASAQHLGRLIGDVLDLASSEAGQLRLVRQPLDLSEVLREASLVGEQMARDKGLGWRATLPATGPWVLGDRTRLRQVVLNLVANAVKFTERGEVALQARCTGDHASVEVTDTGPGIPAEERAKVFDEFYHADREAHTSGGLGLGLAIARQLVEHHGGSIDVRPAAADGRGSTFSFRLPVLDPDLDPGLERSGSRGVRADVLVFTDGHPDPSLVEALRERGLTARIERLAPGDDPTLIAARIRPGAVILDGRCATTGAWQLARSIRDALHPVDTPIHAYRMDQARERTALFELAHLVKPVQVGDLARALSTDAGSGGAIDGRTILIVDDDPTIRELHARVAEEAGARAVLAADGVEALAVLEASTPDLVLLDLAMPRMDGFDVLEAMRTRPSTRDIPVVVVTGQVLTDDDLARLDRGVATILDKGIYTPRETVARIESAVARRRTLGSATQQLVRRATAFIQAHHAESISRDDIARHVAMSPDYLTDCFHKELGITPIAYLNRCRVAAAKALLDGTDLSVTAVAMRVGFSEVSHFTRTFHREVGVSPRAYRSGRHPSRGIRQEHPVEGQDPLPPST